MAMLLEPEVFARTWGERARPRDGTPPVDRRSGRTRSRGSRRGTRDFLFVAEVYWDLEWALQQEGFDLTYDKRLYDRLRAGARPPVLSTSRPRRRSGPGPPTSWRTTTSRARPRSSRPTCTAPPP